MIHWEHNLDFELPTYSSFPVSYSSIHRDCFACDFPKPTALMLPRLLNTEQANVDIWAQILWWQRQPIVGLTYEPMNNSVSFWRARVNSDENPKGGTRNGQMTVPTSAQCLNNSTKLLVVYEVIVTYEWWAPKYELHVQWLNDS